MRRDKSSVEVEIVPVPKHQEPILANLLQLYLHDLTAFHDLPLGPDGRYAYAHLSLYWTEPDRHPFFITLTGELAGFALIKMVKRDEERDVKRDEDRSSDQPVWDMAEFFVIRSLRRRGVGAQAAHQLWRRFPGAWQVRVMQSNRAALRFWAGTISEFCGAPVNPVAVQKDNKQWSVFSFHSGQ